MKKDRAALIAASALLCLLGIWCDAGCARDGAGNVATEAPASTPLAAPGAP